jgi:hypothetical protein
VNSDLVGRLSSFLELVLTRCRNRHNFSTFSIAAKVRLCLASLRWQLPRRAGMAACRCCQNSAPDGPIASHGNDMATAVYGSVIAGQSGSGAPNAGKPYRLREQVVANSYGRASGLIYENPQ